MKVSDVLYPLQKNALRRLCQRRDFSDRGTKKELRTLLARSYRGNLSELVEDLRRVDLEAIKTHYSEAVEFPSGLWAMSAEQLRQVCLTVFEGRYPYPQEEAKLEVQDAASEEGKFVGPDGEKAEVTLYVTGFEHELSGGESVNEMALQRMAADADSVTVLSAYYVLDVLETIAGACRGSVRVILNGLGGKRLARQRCELLDLQKKLHKPSRPVKISLAFAEGLFHTKMYLFNRGRDTVAWVGSANATKAGLNGRNEEVLVKLAPAPRSVLDYAEGAWCRATPLEECQDTVNSLIAFFRTGVLYYEPYANLVMTLNPFRDLMKRLPHSEKRKIARVEPSFANPEGGIGAFNLNFVFNDSVRIDEDLEGLPDRGSVQFRPFAIETCYGYWVAEPLQSEVEEKLHRASEGQQQRLEALREWMKRERQVIVNAYTLYLQDVRNALKDLGVQWQKYKIRPRLFKDTSAVERHLDGLLAVLDSESRLYRHCQAYVSSEVPEIWEDESASNAFMDSYFGSLASALSAQRRSGSAKLILDSLGLSEGSSEDIRDTLEAALESENWYKENFAIDKMKRR